MCISDNLHTLSRIYVDLRTGLFHSVCSEEKELVEQALACRSAFSHPKKKSEVCQLYAAGHTKCGGLASAIQSVIVPSSMPKV